MRPSGNLVDRAVFQMADGPPATRDVVLVRASEDLDCATEHRWRQELGAVCTGDGAAPRVLLFLGERIFVDLRGLDVLLECAGQARRAGRQLIVVAPPRSLRRMVDVLGLQAELRLAATAWEAAAHVIRAGRTAGRGGTG